MSLDLERNYFVGSNFFVRDRELAIEWAKYIQVIEKNYPKFEEKYLSIETSEKLTVMQKNKAGAEIIPDWLATRNYVRTFS